MSNEKVSRNVTVDGAGNVKPVKIEPVLLSVNSGFSIYNRIPGRFYICEECGDLVHLSENLEKLSNNYRHGSLTYLDDTVKCCENPNFTTVKWFTCTFLDVEKVDLKEYVDRRTAEIAAGYNPYKSV